MPWLPESASVLGQNIDFLFYVILVITGVSFYVVMAPLVYFVLRYRYRPGLKSHYVHGNHLLEIIWTVVPALILFWLALYQGATWASATQRPPQEDEAVVIQVEAQQFAWQARYAGADGELGTPDDVLPEVGQIFVPVDRPVLIRLVSKDVLHSFYLPHLRVKQDAVPGRTTQTWFVATRAGQFELACAELCGLGHFAMRGLLTVQAEEAFQAWLSGAQGELARAAGGGS